MVMGIAWRAVTFAVSTPGASVKSRDMPPEAKRLPSWNRAVAHARGGRPGLLAPMTATRSTKARAGGWPRRTTLKYWGRESGLYGAVLRSMSIRRR
jgi:hypothetical protein